jgi:lipoprotein-anchoring transpeptidase ErfK/SrfK
MIHVPPLRSIAFGVALLACACSGDTEGDHRLADAEPTPSPSAISAVVEEGPGGGEEPTPAPVRLAHEDSPGAPAEASPSDTADSPPEHGPPYPLHGVAFHFLAHVFAEPSLSSPIVGYMRRGSKFRAAEPVEGDGCEGGWHRLAGDGFVCRARGFLLGQTPRSFSPAPVPPALEDPLPYAYARVGGERVPQYWRIPTSAEERATAAWLERSRGGPLVHGRRAPADAGTGAEPEQDAGETSAPDVVRLRMRRGFYVSVDAEGVTAEDDDRTFVRTVRGTFVPDGTLAPVTPPDARGVTLGGRHRLPVAFVVRPGSTRHRLDPATGRLLPAGAAEIGDAFEVRDRRVHGGRPYLVARDGTLVREHVVRVARHRERPARVSEGERWIHVSLADQTLVAYEGDRAVFATVVSSGRPGFATPTGLYRIFSKHVTATMDDLASEEPFLIEDVPWVMYFERSYALHGAFWHSAFGRVRSHGCVNLAPGDAQWVFRWSTPALPPAWHGVEARAGRSGTPILIEEAAPPP